MSLIEIDGLTKRFGDVEAVSDLSLRVDDGEVFGFLGPNGAGKSTTINVMLGFMRPTAGSVSVFGRDATEASVEIRRHTGSLLEGYGVYESVTTREHVQSAVETKRADDDPDEILARVGLDSDVADRAAGDLSKGLRQRLALGMALVGDPDLLVLDEPTTGLDPNGARTLRRIVTEEADRGATVFFSSHILEQVEAVADRVGIVEDGSLVTAGPVDELRDRLDADTTLSIRVSFAPEELVADLRSFDGVSAVEATESELTVTCHGGDTKLRVLNAVSNAEVGYRDFTTREPSLEDVFSAATGGGVA